MQVDEPGIAVGIGHAVEGMADDVGLVDGPAEFVLVLGVEVPAVSPIHVDELIAEVVDPDAEIEDQGVPGDVAEMLHPEIIGVEVGAAVVGEEPLGILAPGFGVGGALQHLLGQAQARHGPMVHILIQMAVEALVGQGGDQVGGFLRLVEADDVVLPVVEGGDQVEGGGHHVLQLLGDLLVGHVHLGQGGEQGIQLFLQVGDVLLHGAHGALLHGVAVMAIGVHDHVHALAEAVEEQGADLLGVQILIGALLELIGEPPEVLLIPRGLHTQGLPAVGAQGVQPRPQIGIGLIILVVEQGVVPLLVGLDLLLGEPIHLGQGLPEGGVQEVGLPGFQDAIDILQHLVQVGLDHEDVQFFRPILLILQQLAEVAGQVRQQGQIVLHVLLVVQLIEPEHQGDVALHAGGGHQGFVVAVELLALQLQLAELTKGVIGQLLLVRELIQLHPVHAGHEILHEDIPFPVRVLLIGAQRALHLVIVDAVNGRILHHLMEGGEVAAHILLEEIPVDIRPVFRGQGLRRGRGLRGRLLGRLGGGFRRGLRSRLRRGARRRFRHGLRRNRGRLVLLAGHPDAGCQVEDHDQGQQQRDRSFHTLVSFSFRHLW